MMTGNLGFPVPLPRRKTSLSRNTPSSVVQFVGVLLRPVPSVVTRFMKNGSVEDLLVSSDKPATKDLVVRMASEAATGVIHLHRCIAFCLSHFEVMNSSPSGPRTFPGRGGIWVKSLVLMYCYWCFCCKRMSHTRGTGQRRRLQIDSLTFFLLCLSWYALDSYWQSLKAWNLR